ncbi:hypothetical protein VP01_457g13 [Puccinia sorghi]|uniref:DUF913 domain-containing protein n=1 Tax=Puccinia sorghi TaxID=27349 RepID=A0A0L6UNM9_9BASI|nr:hypothetical protein VP01_457g13 [Puccinia sorghi]
MSTFIHSKPTLLVILQETSLPEALYNEIDNGVEPAFDFIAVIPSALGALCLNELKVLRKDVDNLEGQEGTKEQKVVQVK